MLAASWGVRLAGVPCCAVELEQEIERLEAEAGRDDELVNFSLAGAARDLPLSEHMSVDDVRNMQVAHMSDTESDDSEEEDEERVARISQNALLVSQCGKTLLPGAWRGCAKSPLCDREDRHRGLCNHRATIPGPAACRSLRAQQQEQDDEQDTSSMDQGEVAAYSDVPMQCVEAQQASGGHSHTCQAPCAQGDEREVDSAVHTGGMQGCSHQHIWGAAHQEQEAAAAAAMAAITRSSSGDDDLFWAGNAGQLAAAELFSIPPAYQPRVKDLTAPGGPCLLSMDSDMSDISTPLAAPMAVPAEQHTVAAVFESACSDCSDHTNTVACAPNSGSAPSSPSCASADLAAFGPFQPQAVATHLADTAAAAPPAAASSPCTPDSTAAMAAAFAVAEHSEAAAVAAEAAAAAAPVGLAAAGAAAAKHAVQDSTRMEAHAAAAVAPIAATGSSTQAALEHAAAEAATAEAVAAAAAAAALVASGLASPPAAASPRAAPAAAAATVAQAPAAPQRPPRIRSKPSKSVMKAAAAVVEPSSSPKSKKRPATSRAPGSGGHCCTSCGAVSTPVWRAGPAGPKTLCNACGVRYMKVAKRK